MIAEKIINLIEDWAPPGAAWKGDNVGLQVGSPRKGVSNIFLCLELTQKSLNEAIKKNVDFIFTHHPFIFKPIKSLNTNSDSKAKIIEQLIKNDITLYSAHTNLDFTKEGVSFQLAKTLRLENQRFLVNEESNQYKISVFVPQENVEDVSSEMFRAGAGIIGEYENCSYQSLGKGTFKGSAKSNPTVGKKNNFEVVNEIRLEMLVDSWKLNKVITALKKSHPYEEPAFDIFSVKNNNVNFGFGVIGELKTKFSTQEFLTHVCTSLKTPTVRYTKGKSTKIKTVAVCGGSGSELVEDAIAKGADAFVTADIKYHPFQDAENRILFIDAGHYETEILILDVVKTKLEEYANKSGEPIKIFKYSGSTNPIKYFNK